MILITGGLGFIGLQTARRLLDLGARDDAFMDLTRIREDVGYSPEWPVAMADYISWLKAGNSE